MLNGEVGIGGHMLEIIKSIGVGLWASSEAIAIGGGNINEAAAGAIEAEDTVGASRRMKIDHHIPVAVHGHPVESSIHFAIGQRGADRIDRIGKIESIQSAKGHLA